MKLISAVLAVVAIPFAAAQVEIVCGTGQPACTGLTSECFIVADGLGVRTPLSSTPVMQINQII